MADICRVDSEPCAQPVQNQTPVCLKFTKFNGNSSKHTQFSSYLVSREGGNRGGCIRTPRTMTIRPVLGNRSVLVAKIEAE